MKRFLFILLCFAATAQNDIKYALYTGAGKVTQYQKLLKASKGAEVILFGEHHDNTVVHRLQLELTKDIAKKKEMVLGAEMLESDNQQQLDMYLAGKIDQGAFDTLARLWPNHKTDYQPLVDFAKEQHIPFIATNIPRRYASIVYKGGFEALGNLPKAEKAWVAPLPIAYDAGLPGYKAMLEISEGHGGDNLPKAQAVKDATMAHFILKNLKPKAVFVHYNGTYHSDNYEGIGWYLKRARPSLNIVTIATVSQKDIAVLDKENMHRADFIIVVEEIKTQTK